MPLITFSIKIEVSEESLRAILQQMAEKAVDAGAKKVVELNEELINNWDHPVAFTTTKDSASGLASRTIRCDDQIWQWVNSGTAAKTFFGPLMVFPFQGPGASYDRKTYTGRTGSSLSGRTGPKYFTRSFSNRSIEARHMAQKVRDEHQQEILDAMTGALVNG